MMKLFFPFLLLHFLAVLGLGCQPQAQREAETAPPEPPFRQLLVVLTADWDTAHGTLQRFVWQREGWRTEGGAIPVIIGRNGLGWGRGVADFTDLTGPVKQEGDLKSPAGIFRLGTAFGYAPASEADFVQFAYTPVIASTMCIEDTASAAYNRIIDETAASPDWNSTDHMLRDDDLYEWGMLVEHNYETAQPGGGSCIFLHVWRGPQGNGTAGCTSMNKRKMKDLLAWLDPAQSPALVQVPRNEYARLQQHYDLPAEDQIK